jgi:hypothetical protein
MSKSLFLPTTVLEEAALGGSTTASEALGSRGAMEFVNNSLSTIQTFFSRMIQLDPAENELFGETGRDVNGFRLTTEDEPAGVDHDTAISIRSGHISALGIQSGKDSTSDALLCMGTWDGSEWGVNGTLRIDMSDGNAFKMESNYGYIKMNNDTDKPALVIDSFNMVVIGPQVGATPTDDFVAGTCALYVSGGELYAQKQGSAAVKLT